MDLSSSLGNATPARSGASTVVALAMALAACSGPDGGETAPELPSLERLGRSARVPPSLTDDIALLSSTTVCLVDSYRVRVLCGDRSWDSTWVAGREGKGPGEYQEPGPHVARGPEGSLAVVDLGASRLVFFTPDGSYRRTVRVPLGFNPLGRPEEGVWAGTHFTYGDTLWSAPVAWVSLGGDTVVRRLKFRHSSEATEGAPPGGVAAGARAPDGEFVFWVGGSRFLARYTEEGRFIEEFTSPAYEPELPSERDVAVYEEGYRELFGRAPAREDMREFQNRPKALLVRGEPLRFDSAGRLWAATTRDHEERSWFDLFREGGYLGSVRVRDRMLGFDLLGATLAVLVEGREQDGAGLYPRYIDWYRIRE